MALARAVVQGQPDAGDESFWNAIGIPEEMREGIVKTAVTVAVWPESETPLAVFMAMQTQWRVGMGGPTGLDYAALPVVMDLQQVPAGKRRDVFNNLRIMESEALKVFSDGRR